MGQMLDYNTSNPSWSKFNTSALAYPCGLMPKAYFQDTFQLFKCADANDAECKDSTPIFINETNIANKYDREYAFLLNSTGKENDYWTDITNGKHILNYAEHFIIWMEMESFKNFWKIWGKIDGTPLKGKYKIRIKSSKHNI